MQNPEPFDPLKLGRYTVFKVEVSYPGQPPAEKFFVVLRHHKHKSENCVLSLKTTSKTSRYENDPEAATGAIIYEAGEVSFFPVKTAIEIANPHRIPHAIIQEAAEKGKFRICGKLPEDFRSRIVEAIKSCDVYSPKDKRLLLEAIDEDPSVVVD